MQTSHILCFQETKINQTNSIGKYIDTSRYNYIHNYDKHGILMMYKQQMICASYQTRVNNGSEFIATSFNLSTRNAIYVITVYRAHSTKITLFLETLNQLIIEAPIECPIIILGDFNIDVSRDTIQYYEMEKILNYMQKHKLKQKTTTPTTIKNSLIDHIWSNIPGINTQYGVRDAYWPDYTNLYIVPSNYRTHYHNMFDTPKRFILYDHESLMPPNSYEDHESLMPTNPYGNIWKSINFHYFHVCNFLYF
jgi:exonuclease III